MKRFTAILSSTVAVAALLVSAGPAAVAATGEVVVFTTEVVPLDVHETLMAATRSPRERTCSPIAPTGRCAFTGRPNA